MISVNPYHFTRHRDDVAVHVRHHWPGASQFLRYIKNIYLAFSCILSALLLSCIVPQNSSAQEKHAQATAQTGAPTGTYTCPDEIRSGAFPFATTNSVPVFTLRLETNGTYVANSAIYTDSYGRHPDVARGTWRWDAQNREFLLEPGSFTFYIKRLQLDKSNPNRLIWGASFLQRQESK